MNILDIIVLAILLLFVIQGIRKGFVISLATLVALVLGIWVAVHFSNYLDKVLNDAFHPSGTWLPILSFSITFLCVVLLVMLVAKGVEKLVSLVGMGILNRIAGGIFGLVKGIIFLSVLIFIICKFDPKGKIISREKKEGSIFFSNVEKVFPFIIRISGSEIKFPSILPEEKK
jgi:membrane protein required for colicin V production